MSFNIFLKEISLAEQQDYVDQISLLQSKLNHLEEALKFEEQEKLMLDKLNSHKAIAAKEAELLAKKKHEKATEEIQLQQEEGARRKLVKKMMTDTDKNLLPITNFLGSLDGKKKHTGRKTVI